MPAAKNNKQFKTIGSDKVDQCNFELTNTSLLIVDSFSLYSILIFVPRIKTVLAIMIHYCTKHIPVSHVSFCKLVPGISLCQSINTLVCTKDILRVSVCQNVLIMTCVINVWRSVTPQFTTFDCTDSYIFPVRTSVLFCPSVFPLPVWLISYLSKWFSIRAVCLKFIATLCSRCVSSPPLYEEFSSSFRFLQFSHWTVQIWNMSKIRFKKIRNKFISINFAHFLVVLVRKCMVKNYWIYDCFGF